MEKKVLCWIMALLPFVLASQNLVGNPSFEEHKTCEFIDGAIDSNLFNPPVVYDWCSGNLSGTPDYFNVCQSFNNYYHLTVPLNNNGFQNPVFGNAYAGICNQLYFTTSIDFRDYLQTKLEKKLSKGVSYCVGFYTSFAESDSSIIKDGWSISAIKNWGLLLSSGRPFNPTVASSTSPPTAFTLAGDPQIKATDFIKDTSNWTLVSGTYTATGEEQWITIGNFNPPGQTPVDTFYHGTTPNNLSYYYIDNVFVIPMNDGSLLPNDTSICEASFPLELSAANGFFNYQWSNGDTTRYTTIGQPGIYSITATYEGCQIFDTIQVSDKPVPVLDLPEARFCENQLPQTYSIPNGLGFSTFLWSNGSSGPNTIIDKPGELILIASGECGTASDTLHIAIDSTPVVDLGYDRSICDSGSTISIQLANLVGPLPNYVWSNGQTTQQININTAGLYSLATTNLCGTFTDEINIEGCPPHLYIPNVFHPDSPDFENAFFKPYASNAEIVSLDIYDRWGEHIFSQSGEGEGWNGFWRGRLCSAGVYTYVVRYKNRDDLMPKAMTGDVLLIK